MEGNEDSCENNTSAINALLDLTGTLSECSEKIFEKSKTSITADVELKQKDSKDIQNITKIMSTLSPNQAQEPDIFSKIEQERNGSNYLQHPAISSSRETATELDSPRENSENEANLQYTSDFSSASTTQTTGEMTAWEKWFVMKEKELRKRAEIDRRKALEKLKEMERQEILKQKKKEESETSRRQWLARKKMEMQMEQEMKESKEERLVPEGHAFTFETWILRKYQQKKVEHLRRDYMKKKEEEEKKKKLKQSEEAVKRWMAKAKEKPLTPRISYAFCGGSTVGFYDSTRPPSPTFVNPIPWEDPCISPSH